MSIVGWSLEISEFSGVIGTIPSIEPTLLKLNIKSALTAALIGIVFTLLFVDFFDTAGTLTCVANISGKICADGKI